MSTDNRRAKQTASDDRADTLERARAAATGDTICVHCRQRCPTPRIGRPSVPRGQIFEPVEDYGPVYK